jgi:hypothetical protein
MIIRMSANPTLLEAIALKKCVRATYNRVEMKLAPHILYTRNDALFIDAVALEKAGAPPREKKLGAFKLDGLSALTLTDEPFDLQEVFDPAAPKYDGATVFAVEG